MMLSSEFKVVSFVNGQARRAERDRERRDRCIRGRQLRHPRAGPLLVLISLASLSLIARDGKHLFVAGQLEAVGAVMSVIPVTSILATAGLVGVKLAALSRLLQVLGYDQAYLANGGTGTAAHPIGLQTKYSYMFPYVPGLNVSVSGEDRAPSFLAGADQQPKAPRKTYPAMGLPGDYENQQRPFRGAESLRDIYQSAGLELKVPLAQQQLDPSVESIKGSVKQQQQQQQIVAQSPSKGNLQIPHDHVREKTQPIKLYQQQQHQQKHPQQQQHRDEGKSTQTGSRQQHNIKSASRA